MNLLASVLPGLRDVRTPLAAGYLWLACIWLAVAPALPPSEGRARHVVMDVLRVGDVLGTTALLFVLSFAAYLLGILLRGLGGALVALAASPVRRVFGWFLRSASRRHRRQHGGPRSGDEIVRQVDLQMQHRYRSWLRTDRIRWRVADILLERLADKYRTEQSFRDAVAQHYAENEEALTRLLLWANKEVLVFRVGATGGNRQRRTAEEQAEHRAQAEAGFEEFTAQLQQEVRDVGLGQVVLTLEAARPRDWPDVLANIIDLETEIDDLMRELRAGQYKLVASNVDLFNRWDQLRSEGDFRAAVSAPLTVLGFVLSARLGPVSWAAAGLAIAVLLARQARQQRLAADLQMLEYLNVGVIDSAALSRLDAGEVRWITKFTAIEKRLADHVSHPTMVV